MRVWVSAYVSSSPCFSLGVPFYRPRGGTRLHGVEARVGFDRGMGTSRLEASVAACLDGSCYGVLGDDGTCVPWAESSYIAW